MNNEYYKEIELLKNLSLDCIFRLLPNTLDYFPEEMQEIILDSFEKVLENNIGSKEQFAEMFRVRYMLRGIDVCIKEYMELQNRGANHE